MLTKVRTLPVQIKKLPQVCLRFEFVRLWVLNLFEQGLLYTQTQRLIFYFLYIFIMERTFDLLFPSFESIIIFFSQFWHLRGNWVNPPIGVKKGKIIMFGISLDAFLGVYYRNITFWAI